MTSILMAAGSRRIVAGSKVQCMYRGVSFYGTVVGAEHSKDHYVIRIRPSRHQDAYLSRKRYQIEPIVDTEFSDVIEETNFLESFFSQELNCFERMAQGM